MVSLNVFVKLIEAVIPRDEAIFNGPFQKRKERENIFIILFVLVIIIIIIIIYVRYVIATTTS